MCFPAYSETFRYNRQSFLGSCTFCNFQFSLTVCAESEFVLFLFFTVCLLICTTRPVWVWIHVKHCLRVFPQHFYLFLLQAQYIRKPWSSQTWKHETQNFEETFRKFLKLRTDCHAWKLPPGFYFLLKTCLKITIWKFSLQCWTCICCKSINPVLKIFFGKWLFADNIGRIPLSLRTCGTLSFSVAQFHLGTNRNTFSFRFFTSVLESSQALFLRQWGVWWRDLGIGWHFQRWVDLRSGTWIQQRRSFGGI